MGSPFVWYDVTAGADDADKVKNFYAELLGWTIGPDSNPGRYRGWIMDGDTPWGAVLEADDATVSRWVPYIQVDDLDQAVEQATSLGASVVVGKSDGPAGTSVTISDPGGAILALWTPFPDKT